MSSKGASASPKPGMPPIAQSKGGHLRSRKDTHEVHGPWGQPSRNKGPLIRANPPPKPTIGTPNAPTPTADNSNGTTNTKGQLEVGSNGVSSPSQLNSSKGNTGVQLAGEPNERMEVDSRVLATYRIDN